MNKLKRNSIAALMLATSFGFVGASQAASKNYVELNKEIEIMTGVLDTALKQSSGERSIRYRSLDATYLAEQGVVYTVSTRSTGIGLLSGLRDIFISVPDAPAPPDVFISGEDGIEIDFDHDWESFAEETVHHFEEAFREQREEMRELRSKERELAWEQRELEREHRDLKFELRQADREREQELKEELQGVEQKMKQFEQRKQELTKQAQEIEQEQKQKLNKRKEAQQKAYKQFLANFESNIGDALCRFGNGLRGLPESENVSFVLKDFSRNDNNQLLDRVYVFSQDKIKSCVREKINSSQLLSSASVYDF
ncbi:hypothetical protein OPS25_13360 [Alteromonas ponticola]|uniref:DUF3450 family protein n=1 Tax=Alteromonas aquimaris TaxID=2998417 RepID=A0ABT3P9P2_9ALTE|nr:hypothetical protein [Alteromonas aquimaris]MCW8109492.1 hypothetical protein [Alteromonas aquimaris]